MRAAGVFDAVLGLPSPTNIFARRAKPDGGFGLVGPGLTNRYQGLACAGRPFLVGLDPVTIAYQSPDLGQGLPRETFTKHYHRDGDWILCTVITD